ncbi:MAG: aminotransferase class III-fold pyridoxal phosphate-dependent enzyme, partial [Cetobacterium sp.]
VGAFGGKKAIMDMIAPVGRVYHAGTLSGNPVAVRAGYEMVSHLLENRETLYKELEEKVNYITDEVKKISEKYRVPVCINKLGSLFTIFFTELDEVTALEHVINSNTNHYSIYFNTLLDNGVVAPPSKYEAHFVSTAHTKEDLDRTLEVIEMAFKKIGEIDGK